MLDNREADDKFIAVAAVDSSVSHIEDISERPRHFISEMHSFFEDYKKLEEKSVVAEPFPDRATALRIIREAFSLYNSHFG